MQLENFGPLLSYFIVHLPNLPFALVNGVEATVAFVVGIGEKAGGLEDLGLSPVMYCHRY